MYRCPSCRQPTFSGTEKWWSNLRYAECAKCPRRCQVPATSANGIFAVTIALLVFGAIGVAYTQSLLVAVLRLAGAMAMYVWMWHRTDLIPVSKERARAQKRLGIVAAAVYAIFALCS